VDSLVATYDTMAKVMKAANGKHSPDEWDRILRGNAVKTYRLQLGR
jgi:predicted TIM-barrel fold metal-dependent hydrolase